MARYIKLHLTVEPAALGDLLAQLDNHPGIRSRDIEIASIKDGRSGPMGKATDVLPFIKKPMTTTEITEAFIAANPDARKEIIWSRLNRLRELKLIKAAGGSGRARKWKAVKNAE